MINQLLNHHQQQPGPGNDLHWVSPSDYWSGVESSRSLQGSYNQGGNRSDWDWQNQQMLLAHHNNIMHDLQDAGERKLSGDPLMLQQNFFSNGNNTRIPQQSQLLFGALNPAIQGSPFGIHQAQQSLSFPYSSLVSAVPGTGVNVSAITGFDDFRQIRDLRALEQRKRLYGLLDMDPRSFSVSSSVKQEGSLYSPIGLNLGVRTYFSAEDLSVQNRLGKRARANCPATPVPLCQAEGCKADLNMAKHYHRRHKVCELHSKAATVTANGQTQRFCQQCSRFHPLGEFDEGKRSCRKRLADHNRRRRKPQQVSAPAAAAASDHENQENEPGGGSAATEELRQQPGTPASSSQEHSDNNNSLSKSCHGESKSSGAHSTLFDRPAALALDTRSDLVSALSSQSQLESLIKTPMNQEEQQQHLLLQKPEQNLMKQQHNHLSAHTELMACTFISSWMKPVEQQEAQNSSFRNLV